MQLDQIQQHVIDTVLEIAPKIEAPVTAETQLIGPQAVLKSRQLVELLLALEEFAEEKLGTEFDWRSDSAMSANRSIFRSVGVLAEHLHRIQA